MRNRKIPVMKHPRDIGRVVFPIEKMMAAREVSSCCVGVEALLESDSKSIWRQLRKERK